LCFFLLDTRWKYLFGWQELLWKIHSTPKIYSSPPPSSNICLVHFTSPPSYMTKKFHSKIWRTLWKKVDVFETSNSWSPSSRMAYRCLLKRKQKFSTKKSKIFKINGKTSKRLSWKGFDWWYIFLDGFFSPYIGGKKIEKKKRKMFFFPNVKFFWGKK